MNGNTSLSLLLPIAEPRSRSKLVEGGFHWKTELDAFPDGGVKIVSKVWRIGKRMGGGGGRDKEGLQQIRSSTL